MPHITLKHDTVCADCGAPLAAGTKARWFRDGSVYGSDCHRWVVAVSAARQKKLQNALRGILQAGKQRVITDSIRDRIARLKPACERQLTASTWEWLIRELGEIRKEIER